jgi:hypothetical protein
MAEPEQPAHQEREDQGRRGLQVLEIVAAAAVAVLLAVEEMLVLVWEERVA